MDGIGEWDHARMMIAHRSIYLDRTGKHYAFIGWTLIAHGIIFAAGGFVPTLWLFTLVNFVSRAVVGVEYAVQETMFQRSLPDKIRDAFRRSTVGQMTVFGIMAYASSELMYYITPQTLTIASGILSAFAGVVWFIRERSERPDEAVV
ncbi:MAG: hypothetical protein R2682_04040 [Pyrinomonadaceae bacterium]